MNKKEKLKKKIINFFADTGKIFEEHKLFIIYVFGAVINGCLLRIFTIGQFRIAPLLADIFIVTLVASLYFKIKEKNRFTYLFVLSILTVIACLANMVYYSYFKSFISVTFITFITANTETGDANVVGNLLKWYYFIVIWLPIALVIAKFTIKNKKLKLLNSNKDFDKIAFKNVLQYVLIFFLIFVCTLKTYDYSRIYQQWNREYLISKFGVYLYQFADVIKSVEPSMSSLFGADKAYVDVDTYYEENKVVKSENEYTNIFEGKNVIAIHAESIQTLAMEQSFNGLEVTPNLNKLASEGIYFSNFYSQVSIGTSSDTEFTLTTSLMPINNGTVFVNYFDRDYISLYEELDDIGYYTFSMHANTGSFWNRNIMYETLGYDYFYEKSSYVIDETIGFGLSDASFFKQSVLKIKEISKTNEKYYGTMIMLSNHTPFDDVDKYGPYDVSLTVDGVNYPYMEGTKLGNYFKSVHYADQQIGEFIDMLDEEGLLDNTVIIIYGDHDARISKNDWDRLYNYDYLNNSTYDKESEEYTLIDSYWYEINRRVPFIIWTKDKTFQEEYSKEITSVTGMIDYAPTIGNMFGVYNKYALGKDMITEEENMVVLPDGSFITDSVYYNDSKEEYVLKKEVPLGENYIAEHKKQAEDILQVSSNIIIYNYFGNKFKTNQYGGN